jgi:hypothetical protein
MGGGLLEWRWGRSTTTNTQQTKKDKSACTRKKSTRRVRFKEGNSGEAAAVGSNGGGVVQGKEKKRVWFSRIWLSIRRKEGRRRAPPEKTAIELPSKSEM